MRRELIFELCFKLNGLGPLRMSKRCSGFAKRHRMLGGYRLKDIASVPDIRVKVVHAGLGMSPHWVVTRLLTGTGSRWESYVHLGVKRS